MNDPVGQICHLVVDGEVKEFHVTPRIMSDHVSQHLRRVVKDEKRAEIKRIQTELAEIRKEMLHAPQDFQAIYTATIEKMSQMIIDSGRASESDIWEALGTRRGCATALREGVVGSPPLEKCLEIFASPANINAFGTAILQVLGEESEAVKNSSSQSRQEAGTGEQSLAQA